MSRQTPRQPNVLVFFTDQQRWDASGLHGNPLDLMPNFDRFARRHTHLAHAFTCAPVCGPARACWQTGTHCSTNGAWTNGVRLDPELPSLANAFKAAGYRTGYIGKWHLAGKGQPKGPVEPDRRGGYEDWLAADVLEFTSDAYHTRLYDNDGNERYLPGYRVDGMADEIIRYIHERSREDQPFFLYTSFIEPHHQNHIDDYPPPDGYRERYAGRWTPPDLAALPHFGVDEPLAQTVGGTAQQHLGGYWGMIKRLDEAFGRILDALKSLGLDENTIVLFTSDHACHFKTRNGEYKRSCHDSSIRVPSAIGGPGFVGGGQFPHPVSLVDLPATLLDACGIDVPETFEGHSIHRKLRDPDADWPEEMFVQVVDAEVGRAVRTERWKYAVTAPGVGTGQNPQPDEYVEAYLYDLEADPYELRNLVHLQSHAPVREVMRQRLIQRMTALGEPEPKIVEAKQRGGGQRSVTEEEARS
jgi:arylsulfatase A-like enzyme